MKMLAVSTSAKIPSAALLDDAGDIALLCDTTAKPHSVSLMPLVDELLEKNGLSACDIDVFAVDIGPGSFTGVRIGVSAVNAMAFASGKRIVPVPSLCALRHLAKDPTGTVCTMLDARSGNGYAAVFIGGACTVLPCACTQKEILDQLPIDSQVIGDCMGGTDQCDARLVILEALDMLRENEDAAVTCAVPLTTTQCSAR